MQTLDLAGSRGGIRTPDRVVNSHLLCRLSYPGISVNSVNNKRKPLFISKNKAVCQ